MNKPVNIPEKQAEKGRDPWVPIGQAVASVIEKLALKRGGK